MAEMQYVTLIDPRFAALELIDVGAVAAAVTDRWYNETLCRVNDSLVRVGVLQGEYHWHTHDGDDEFFYIVDGGIRIELEGRPAVELGPRQGFVVPSPTRVPSRSGRKRPGRLTLG